MATCEPPPLPPEGERGPRNVATYWQLPRDFSLFGSPWLASKRITFREVLPFCCHGGFLGRAFMLPERRLRGAKIRNIVLIAGSICPAADNSRIALADLAQVRPIWSDCGQIAGRVAMLHSQSATGLNIRRNFEGGDGCPKDPLSMCTSSLQQGIQET